MTVTRIPAVILCILALLMSLSFPVPTGGHGERHADSHSGNNTEDVYWQGARWHGTLFVDAWKVNGCTRSPDSARGVFYFNHACNHHDGCYGLHWHSRYGCDREFHRNMTASCKHNWPWYNQISRWACYEVRDLYYRAVRWLGYVAYNGWSISGPTGW